MRIEPSIRKQRGAALLILAAILILGTSWMVVAGLKNSTDRNARARAHNGDVLKQAKDALIGHVIAQAATTDETELSYKHPGRFPCPEDPAIAGTLTEGTKATSCTLPAIGRLPWRSLGIDKLTDGAGEPLWYVLSSGWTGTAGTFTINSNTQGQLTLDGSANAAVALIIAPGEALNIQPNSNQSAAGCIARNQSALRASLPPNFRDFLECQNNPSASFVTTIIDNATNAVLNDQVVTVRVEDFMPLLEGVVAKRMAIDIVPKIQSIYATASWGASSTNPVFPFATPFGNPATSVFEGASGTFQGLGPFTRGECTIGETRCNPSFVQWLGSPAPTVTLAASPPSVRALHSGSCSLSGSGASQLVNCALVTGDSGALYVTVKTTASNVGMSLRAFDTSANGFVSFNTTSVRTASATISTTDGSARIAFTGRVSAFGSSYSGAACSPYASPCRKPTISIPVLLLADPVIPAILNPNDPTAGWFTFNGWHELTYYAISPEHAPSGSRACSGASCLVVQDTYSVLSNPSASSSGQRALLILAGRRLSAASANLPTACVTASQASRPSANPDRADYLECVAGGISNSDNNSAFIQKPVNSTFNDRIVLIDQNP